MLLGTGLILNWLIRHNHRPELGIHFAGLGLGIAGCSIVVALLSAALDWREQWYVFTAIGCVLLVDEVDKADEEFDLGVAMEEREAAELLAIDEALQRVADGSYGLCLQCGASIPAARLHAQPTAERCVGCQTRSE